MSVDPAAAYGAQATEVEKACADGWELHGTPFVWMGYILQALIRKPVKESKRG